jgi:hypothetical protein
MGSTTSGNGMRSIDGIEGGGLPHRLGSSSNPIEPEE